MVLAWPCLHVSLSNFCFIAFSSIFKVGNSGGKNEIEDYQVALADEIEIIWWVLSPFIKNVVVLVNHSVLSSKEKPYCFEFLKVIKLGDLQWNN